MNSRLRLNTSNVFLFAQSLFALLLAAPSVASAAGTQDIGYIPPSGAYYVSPNGSGTCLSENSPCSVATAILNAPPGSTIVFRGGYYRNVNTSIRKKLTLQPYHKETVWIKGSDIVGGWVPDNGIWRKDNWQYSFPSSVANNPDFIDLQNYPMAGYGDMVYINGVTLKQVATKNEVGPGKFYVDSTNKKLYIGDNPTGKMVEATARKSAFSIGKFDLSDPTGTVVRGLNFTHYAESPISLGAPQVTIENNSFTWNGIEGVSFQGMSGGVLGISSDCVVRGNIFSYNGRKGLGGSRAHRILVENNKISYNNQERFSQRGDAAGVKFVKTDGAIVRKNIVENNIANGIWFDLSSTNTKIVHNTIRNNERYGIFLEVSHNAIIGANVAYENETGIHVSNSSSVKVYNNTLAKNVHNLHIDDSTRNNDNSAEIAAGITWIAKNIVVKNNLLSNQLDLTDSMLFHASNSGSCNDASQPWFSAIDYNGYYRTSSLGKTWRAVRWSPGGPNDIVYTTVPEFRAATGFEGNALVIDNAPTNPFFADEANDNYNLKLGSQAIGRGDTLPPDVALALGWPSGVKVDLGALPATK